MRAAAVGRRTLPGTRAVARAIAVVAQEGAAALHAPLLAVQRLGWSRGVGDPQADAGGVGIGVVPVGDPFPDIAGHVVQAIRVGFEAAHRRRAGIAIGSGVAGWEDTLPDVGEPAVAAAVIGLVAAPDVGQTIDAPTCRAFPFSLGGQAFAGPAAVGVGIFPGQVHHRVICPAAQAAAWAFGCAPTRAGRPLPPLRQIAQVDFTNRHHEDQRARLQHRGGRRLCAGPQLRPDGLEIDRAFSHRAVAGGLHKALKLRVGDLGLVDEIGPTQQNPVRRSLISPGPLFRAAHEKFARRDGSHALGSAGCGLGHGHAEREQKQQGHLRDRTGPAPHAQRWRIFS